MRVIAGAAKGRRLQTVRGAEVRPTSDKVKGALFSIVASRFTLEGAHVLDLFAGSGALGIEALSRGAAHVTFVEQAATAVSALRRNLDLCGFASRARVLQRPVRQALSQLARAGQCFDGVVIDPPYKEGLVDSVLTALEAPGLLAAGAWVVVEHHVDEAPVSVHGALRLTHAARYGKTGLALFVTEQMAGTQKNEPIRRAVYAGSFDPITNGHLDVIHRAIEIFDEVIVAVAAGTSDPHKSHAFFTAAERVEMIQEALADAGGRARADSFTGLLVDYCERVDARVNIRGLRAVSDFEYEFQMAMMNRHLKPQIETVFMAASEEHFYTSSRLVKEVAGLGGNVGALLPAAVHRRLLQKLGRR